MTQKKPYKINLEEQRIDTPFSVDNEYFDDLPQQVQQKIHGTARKTNFPVFIKYGIASAMLTIVGIMVFNMNFSNEKNAQTIIASMAQEDLVAYLNEENISSSNPYDIEMEEAMEIAIQENISFSEVELISKDEAEEIVKEEQYDILENEDTEGLIEELELDYIDDLDF